MHITGQEEAITPEENQEIFLSKEIRKTLFQFGFIIFLFLFISKFTFAFIESDPANPAYNPLTPDPHGILTSILVIPHFMKLAALETIPLLGFVTLILILAKRKLTNLQAIFVITLIIIIGSIFAFISFFKTIPQISMPMQNYEMPIETFTPAIPMQDPGLPMETYNTFPMQDQGLQMEFYNGDPSAQSIR